MGELSVPLSQSVSYKSSNFLIFRVTFITAICTNDKLGQGACTGLDSLLSASQPLNSILCTLLSNSNSFELDDNAPSP